MHIKILGTVTITDQRTLLQLTRQPRQLLLLLALSRCRPLTSDQLKTLLWDDPDRDTTSALTTITSKLRATVGDRLRKTERGYHLELKPDDRLDLDDYLILTAEARGLRDHALERAERKYAAALRLCSEDLHDLPHTRPAQDMARPILDNIRNAREAHTEILLALGRHDDELARSIREMLDADPLNEHLWAQLMIGLYRNDRTADAVRAYWEAEDALQRELGIEPGIRLRRLLDQIRRHDPELSWTPARRRQRSAPLAEGLIDVNTVSAARIYDYLLDGSHNFPVDQQAAAHILEAAPDLREVAQGNRQFLGNAVRNLTKLGIRQFLDLGSGLPTQENVHEVAQRVDPTARVVYVDNDPIVETHATALLADDPNTEFLLADIRDPQGILAAAPVRDFYGSGEPAALLMLTILHFLDDEQARHVIDALMGPLPSGSFMAISHVSTTGADPEAISRLVAASGNSTVSMHPRSLEEIRSLFEGYELLEPGLTDPSAWRSESPFPLGGIRAFGGVARKS